MPKDEGHLGHPLGDTSAQLPLTLISLASLFHIQFRQRPHELRLPPQVPGHDLRHV